MNGQPSKLDLERLREEGVVFVSAGTSRTIARAIAVALLGILVGGMPWTLSFPQELNGSVLMAWIAPWLLFVAVSMGVIVAVSCSLTLLQTKFFIRFSVVDDQPSLQSLLLVTLVDCLGAALFLGVTWYLTQGFQCPGEPMPFLQRVLPRLFLLAGLIGLCKGVVTFFIDRRAFREQYSASA
jgi:hypothetical protein